MLSLSTGEISDVHAMSPHPQTIHENLRVHPFPPPEEPIGGSTTACFPIPTPF